MKLKLRHLFLALAFVCFGTVAFAQFPNFFFNGHTDFPLPETPCYSGTSTTINAAPFIFDRQLWVLYTCSDNRQWARRFNGAVVSEMTDYVPPAPPAPISCTTVNPGPAFTCVNGNWVYTGGGN